MGGSSGHTSLILLFPLLLHPFPGSRVLTDSDLANLSILCFADGSIGESPRSLVGDPVSPNHGRIKDEGAEGHEKPRHARARSFRGRFSLGGLKSTLSHEDTSIRGVGSVREATRRRRRRSRGGQKAGKCPGEVKECRRGNGYAWNRCERARSEGFPFPKRHRLRLPSACVSRFGSVHRRV